MGTKFSVLFFILFPLFLSAQISTYSSLVIADNLKENANSIIRNQSVEIAISSQKSMTIKKTKVVTVLNSKGVTNIDAFEYFNKKTTVKFIEATVYDFAGKEVKKIKRKDFLDQSVADGFSVYNDDRKLFLNYIPISYPFTIVYESLVETSNTAFIPSWFPIDDYLESVEKSQIKITYLDNLGFKYLEENFNDSAIKKNQDNNSIIFTVENLQAEKPEEFSTSFQKIVPHVLFGLEKFNLEGVEGNAKNWKEFGNWMNVSLLKDSDDLPETTKIKILNLTKDEPDSLKKAKIVYQFVQDKTRYVSIQMGIGGWKPMKASEVDKFGYGDCKALSNYTKTLLKSIGINSYYAIIYGDDNKRNIEKDFVSMQGNHAVLALPINNKLCFLECTSQVLPFGFESDFTDDRDALIVSDNDSRIVRTNSWNNKLNAQSITGKAAIDVDGNLSASVQIKSKGIQYSAVYQLERQAKETVDSHYKSHFYWINNLKIDKVKFNNNKDNIEFAEDFIMNAKGYSDNNSGILMFPVNVFNRFSNVPQRYRNRKNPVEIERGFYDEDDIEINLPENFIVDAKPMNFDIKEKFGEYKTEIQIINPNKILYKRKLLINKGFYDKTEYENYRKFIEQIAKADNSKIVLTTKK